MASDCSLIVSIVASRCEILTGQANRNITFVVIHIMYIHRMYIPSLCLDAAHLNFVYQIERRFLYLIHPSGVIKHCA